MIIVCGFNEDFGEGKFGMVVDLVVVVIFGFGWVVVDYLVIIVDLLYLNFVIDGINDVILKINVYINVCGVGVKIVLVGYS